MKAKDSTWFSTPKGSLGLVAAVNETGETKFYLGTAEGFNEKADINNIINWGAKFEPEYVIGFITRNIEKQ